MPRPVSTPKTSRFILLASVCVVVAALYFAQEVLIPVALAMLLTFLLTPVVQKLERWGLGRVPSVMLVVALAFGGIGVLGYVVFNQVLALGNNLPVYKDNIKAKLDWLPKPGQGGVIDKFQDTMAELSDEVTKPTSGPAAATSPTTSPATTPALTVDPPDGIPRILAPGATVVETSPPTTQPVATTAGASRPGPPVPVTIVPAEASPIDLLRDNVAMVAGPLGTAGIVAVFVVFMLLSREDLRDRLIRLVGYGQWTVTTQAMDDAASRISKYLLAQAVVNGTYGAAISVGLWLIGKFVAHDSPPFPNVVLWGLLCAVLRFIPYVGPWVAAAFPLALSLVVYKGFGVFVAAGLMFVVIELLSNNIMEPMLYGASTGMSTVAILVSAVFWTWLWGPIGLLMATPMTVCLVVVGKYVPQLQFLDILLGDEPVLEPHERLYQRWLALDPEEAAELAGEFFEKRSLEDVYDNIVMPALALAEIDRHNNRLDDRRQAMIRESVRGIIEELGDEYRLRFARTGATTADVPGKERSATTGAAADGDGTAQSGQHARRMVLEKSCSINVLILPAHDEADEIVGQMLGQLLQFNNYCAFPQSMHTLAGEMMDLVEKKDADVVCVSALPPSAVTHARYLCKRLHQRFENLRMLVGLWTVRSNLDKARQRITCEESVPIVTKLSVALDQIEQLTRGEVVKQIDAAKHEREAVKQ